MEEKAYQISHTRPEKDIGCNIFFFAPESTSLAMELTPTITCTRTSCTTQDYSLIVWNNHKVLL